jgi:nucleotide-binding universal stress UspA family protein
MDLGEKGMQGGEIVFKKILVPMDGFEPSKHALSAAMESASKWGAELLIVSVIPPVSAFFFGGEGDIMVNTDEYEKELERVHMKVLDDAKEMVKENHPELKVSVSLIKGRVPSAILDVSDSDNIDLIVMGSRGLTGLSGCYWGAQVDTSWSTTRSPF